ncbi:Uncharacterised protein [Kluyvera cryocrescens]|uniref:Uncharacterized protein n=1 Tax=Kluyvera cryocrescens TaxID=580 RepID=A0A485C0S5_KLUCR|nr:Uncharacterised protein [Kluyvera cryocrescens]
MNDITALMATMKAAAEKATEAHERLSAMPSDGLFDASLAENAQLESDITALIAHNDASSPANVLALVGALEKAQAITAAAEKLVRCKGRYHSEQNYRAMAALFGVNTPDLPPLESESRTVTVKLPTGYVCSAWAPD